MRYVSVFSGVEAATLAWEPLGWEPVCFSEIDEFPSAVLAERFPNVPNLGDITKVDWKKAVKTYGKPDLVVGGSPCQSFSIAGGRTGLEGASGLMWEYVRCVRELMPRWLLWENVPGALSSSHGEDFRCLLEALDACGYGLAWRVLDAEFFGVAQRRERVFLVGRLGDVEGPCKVLFEPESLRWDPPSSREKRQELAAGAGCRAACAGFKWHQGSGAGSIGLEDEQSPTLTADYHNPAVLCIPENAINRPTGGTNGPMTYGPQEPSPTLRASKDVPAVLDLTGGEAQAHRVYDSDGIAPSLRAHGPGGNDLKVLCMAGQMPNAMVSGEVCGALSATMHKDPPVVAKTLKIRSGCKGGGKGPLVQEDVSATLGTGNDQTLFEPVAFAANQRGEVRLQGGDGDVVGATPATQSGKQVQGVCQYGDVAGAITARNDGSPCPDRGPSVVAQGYAVRRLTPRECERLQGLPDDWTKVPYRGKPAEECPDTPRYKAIGNSMAVPVMRWIGERIQEVVDDD